MKINGKTSVVQAWFFFQVKNQVDIYGQVNGSHANDGDRLVEQILAG